MWLITQGHMGPLCREALRCYRASHDKSQGPHVCNLWPNILQSHQCSVKGGYLDELMYFTTSPMPHLSTQDPFHIQRTTNSALCLRWLCISVMKYFMHQSSDYIKTNKQINNSQMLLPLFHLGKRVSVHSYLQQLGAIMQAEDDLYSVLILRTVFHMSA